MDPVGNASLESCLAAIEQLLAAQAAWTPLPASLTHPFTSAPIVLLEQYDGNPDNRRDS